MITFRNIVFLFMLVSVKLQAQNTIFTIFRSDLNKADNFYKNLSYANALNLYKNILEEEGETDYINLQIARSYKKLNRLGESEEWYARVISNLSLIESVDKYDYAEALLSNGKYSEAKLWYANYLKEKPNDYNAFRKMQSLSELSVFYEDSLSYTLKQLNINSAETDFAPVFYDNGIVFLSSRNESGIIKTIDATTNESFLDIYYAKIEKDDSLGPPEIFKSKINTKFHEGPITFFDNGHKAIFTKNATQVVKYDHGLAHVNLLELYYAERDSSDNHWKNTNPMPFNNPAFSTAHPYYCEQTNTLYFVSNQPGGYGGTDIYKSKFKNERWDTPENLGPIINTPENEMFPHIYRGSTLCFASNGHPGLGGLDLFYSVKKDTSFSTPMNIGFPINSEADDFSLILLPKGNGGYFSSNRKNGKGADDIYYFKIKNIPLTGIVADKTGQNAIQDVTLTLSDKGKIKNQITDEDGSYFYILKPGKEYTLTATKEGYKEKKISFHTREDSIAFQLPDKIYLDRRSKAYVKGVVKDPSGNDVKNCRIKISNKAAKDQIVFTDSTGTFKCEVDADAENVFIAEKESMIGIENLKVEKMKKGSVVLHLDMEINPFRTYDVRGILKDDKTKSPLSGYHLVVKNLFSKEYEELCTDSNGKFGFKVFTYATYDIIIQYGKRKSSLKGFTPKQDHEFEIYWSEK